MFASLLQYSLLSACVVHFNPADAWVWLSSLFSWDIVPRQWVIGVWCLRTTTLPKNIGYQSKTNAVQYPRNMENSAEPLWKTNNSEYDVATLGTSRIFYFVLQFIEWFWAPAKLWVLFTDHSMIISLRVTELVMSATTSEIDFCASA